MNIWWLLTGIQHNCINFNFYLFLFQCLIMSWYLSCDIQFVVIEVIVVYVYTKNPKYGIALLGTIIGLSISVPFIITLLTGRDGMDKFPIPYVNSILVMERRFKRTSNDSNNWDLLYQFPMLVKLLFRIRWNVYNKYLYYIYIYIFERQIYMIFL